MTALLIKIEDVLCHITPPQQVGCIKHRQMQHHIWVLKGPTLSHNFIRASLTFFSFPPSFVNVIISSLRSQHHFLVGSVAIKEVVFCQEAGIGQSDPFSPHLFSFCTAIVIYPPRHLQAKVGMYLYVGDFLITFGQEATNSR